MAVTWTGYNWLEVSSLWAISKTESLALHTQRCAMTQVPGWLYIQQRAQSTARGLQVKHDIPEVCRLGDAVYLDEDNRLRVLHLNRPNPT